MHVSDLPDPRQRGEGTIDAMGCRRDIAQAIVDEKADHGLAPKGNRGTLHDDVELFVATEQAREA